MTMHLLRMLLVFCFITFGTNTTIADSEAPSILSKNLEYPDRPKEPPSVTNTLVSKATNVLVSEVQGTNSKPEHVSSNTESSHAQSQTLKELLSPKTTDLPQNPNLHPIKSETVQLALTEQQFKEKFDMALKFRTQGLNDLAATNFTILVESEAPDDVKSACVFELAKLAQEANQIARAQQLLNLHLKRWPEDPKTPEVYLRQGMLYRDIGAPNNALTKFYGVMTASLNLKTNDMDYYKRIVVQAQAEIADTYYLQGKFNEATEFLTRLLKLEAPELNMMIIRYKLIRAMSMQDRFVDVIAQAGIFKQLHPKAVEVAEVRYLLADSYRKIGRTREALQEVMELLKAKQAESQKNPESWIYWQQRTGNDIANQLYKEGDYSNALSVYTGLASLDNNPVWQVPVVYQIGLVFERLQQPQKALETYKMIMTKASEFGTNPVPPSIATVLEMAKWRADYLKWQSNADLANSQLTIHKPSGLTAASPQVGGTESTLSPQAAVPQSEPATPKVR